METKEIKERKKVNVVKLANKTEYNTQWPICTYVFIWQDCVRFGEQVTETKYSAHHSIIKK